jgi:hypothetical protein
MLLVEHLNAVDNWDTLLLWRVFLVCQCSISIEHPEKRSFFLNKQTWYILALLLASKQNGSERSKSMGGRGVKIFGLSFVSWGRKPTIVSFPTLAIYFGCFVSCVLSVSCCCVVVGVVLSLSVSCSLIFSSLNNEFLLKGTIGSKS